MTRQYACSGRLSTSATGLSLNRASTLDGNSGGNCPARLSTQVMQQSDVPARMFTRALPTCPAPNNATWNLLGEIISKNSASEVSGKVDCVSTSECNMADSGVPAADRSSCALRAASSSRCLSPRLPLAPVLVKSILLDSRLRGNDEDEVWLTGRGRGLSCAIPENGKDEVRLTSNARALFCSILAAESNQSDLSLVNTSKCRNTAPPQHCCNMGPRGNNSM